LLPPYPAEIEKALSIYRMEKTDDPNFVGSALVEKVLDSPKSKDMVRYIHSSIDVEVNINFRAA
jgi:hypothetical protein